ncbi:DNA primase [bacterium]|nr:DNA primase [bacterium]|tara:strand:+ start:380 stop:2140 length:1761 start_codon:yes stop_codon:yes gene_type:complete
MSSYEKYSDKDDILSKTSLKEYIDKNWSECKKSGSGYKVLCPFHDDKTPSMQVSDDKGLYHCFVCKAGGNLIQFIKEFKNLTYPETLEELSIFFNIKIPRNTYVPVKDKTLNKKMYDFNNKISQFFSRFLLDNERNSKPIKYLQERGFDKEDIQENSLGFAPDSWNTISSTIGEKEELKEIALSLGLISLKDNKKDFYDFFRNRIIFPIKNRQGNILAFAGRTIGDDKAKYINSKESEIFSKRKILYGLNNFNKLNGRKPKYIFIVEGYTDVLMMNKRGLYNVVATMGTALTLDHANEIKKITNKVILCYDSDKAGIDSSFKNIEPLYQFGIEVFSLRLDNGEDPCSYLQTNTIDHFIEKAKKSNLIMEEYMDYLKDKLIEKELSIDEVVDNFVGKIKYVQNYIQRDEFINKFASSFSISKVKVESIINKEFIKNDSSEDLVLGYRILSPQDVIIKVFIEFIDSRDEQLIKKCLEVLKTDFHNEIIEILHTNLNADASTLIGAITDDGVSSMLSDLVFTPFEIPKESILRKKLIEDCIKKIELNSIKDLKRVINLKLSKNVDLLENEEKSLLNELKNLIEKEKTLL